MKIGILTLPLHTNYGGILQAYALQTVLERMGHIVKVIDRNTIIKYSNWKWVLIFTKRVFKKYLLGKEECIFLEKHKRKVMPIIQQKTDKFINKYIHRIIVNDYCELKDTHEFDVYVVGSDQVWRPRYFMNIEDAFLQFAEKQNVKRISYAASFGVDSWEYTLKQSKKCIELIKKFDAISVRERSGIELCRNKLNTYAEWVLDPTMLLRTEDYIKLFKIVDTPQSPGTLLYYILDETAEKAELVKVIEESNGWKAFRIGANIFSNTFLTSYIQPSVEEWIRGFYDAEFVITDSFHACVFSVLFKKQFVVVGNKDRGLSRFESFLSVFGLEDRLINCKTDISKMSMIDYVDVFEKLESLRNISFDFLQRNLNK